MNGKDDRGVGGGVAGPTVDGVGGLPSETGEQ